MLQRLLAAIDRGEAVTQRDLAVLLGVSESLVVAMVAQLVSWGYLKEAGQCAAGCETCQLRKACGTVRRLRVWALTEKGQHAIASS